MTYGSLFSGYGGLDMGVQAALGEGRVAWVSDIEPGPQAILAHHYPESPNLGDITQIDWEDVEPVDVLTGGSPCQDLSMAGQRAGMRPGTRSGLWESMAHAINHIQPRLVVWENVTGALSARSISESERKLNDGAFSLMESDPGRLGSNANEPVLRALGRVLGDLTNLGYDAEWTTVRASDIGAPHRRERIFVVAYPHGSGWEGLDDWASQTPPERHGHTLTCVGDDLGQLLPTPTATYSGNTAENHLSKKPGSVKVTDLRILVEELGLVLLPTPVTSDSHGYAAADLNRNSIQLRAIDALLPTPCAQQGASTRALTMFGDYAPAIERWEQTLGRPAPEPTVRAKSGKPQLSARFVEWMMGLPEGHVTSPEIGISRARQLKALGNGVVPQQAEYAIRLLLGKEG